MKIYRIVWDRKNKKLLFVPEKEYLILRSFPIFEKYFQDLGSYKEVQE